MENTNETIIETLAIVDSVIDQNADTVADTVADAGTDGTKAKREKLPEYRKADGMPEEIRAIRPTLIAMLQDAICKLNADSVEPNTPENLKFIAKIGHHGVGVSVQGWISGKGLSKTLKDQTTSYEFNASLRAIHEQDGTRSGYTVKQRNEAEQILWNEKYNAMLDAKMNDKEFKAKYKTRAIASVKIPMAQWVNHQKANMSQLPIAAGADADTVAKITAQNEVNAQRLTAWKARIDAKCAELLAMESTDVEMEVMEI